MRHGDDCSQSRIALKILRNSVKVEQPVLFTQGIDVLLERERPLPRRYDAVNRTDAAHRRNASVPVLNHAC